MSNPMPKKVLAYLIRNDKGTSELLVPLGDTYSAVKGAFGKNSMPEGIREVRSANPDTTNSYLINHAYIDRAGNPAPSAAFIALEEHPVDKKSLVLALTAYDYEAWRKEAKDAFGNSLRKAGIELVIREIFESGKTDYKRVA